MTNALKSLPTMQCLHDNNNDNYDDNDNNNNDDDDDYHVGPYLLSKWAFMCLDMSFSS